MIVFRVLFLKMMGSKTKKRFLIILIPVLIGIFLWIARDSVLRQFGNFLICEDDLEKVELMFVLGGASFDRGNEATRLF